MSERREDQDEPEQTDSTAGEGSTANTAADVAAGRERPEGEAADDQAEDDTGDS